MCRCLCIACSSRGIASRVPRLHPRQSRITATPGSVGASLRRPTPSGRVSTTSATPRPGPRLLPCLPCLDNAQARRGSYRHPFMISKCDALGSMSTHVILARVPHVPVTTRTRREPRTTTARMSLTVQEKTSLLTVGYEPDLCKAVLDPHRACAQPKNALAGLADLQDGRPPELLRPGSSRWGVVSRRSPGGLPHANPGAEPDDACAGSVEGCPQAGVWSGCARSTGCHPGPSVQDRFLGPSPGRRSGHPW